MELDNPEKGQSLSDLKGLDFHNSETKVSQQPSGGWLQEKNKPLLPLDGTRDKLKTQSS